MLGNSPIAAVFAREITPGVTSLVKKLEKAAASDSPKTTAYLVLMTDDDKAESKLKDLAKAEKIDKVLLMIDNPTGPKSLNIAKEADVTVVLYTKKTVKKTLAFEKGKLTDKAADEVAAAVKEHAAATEKADK